MSVSSHWHVCVCVCVWPVFLLCLCLCLPASDCPCVCGCVWVCFCAFCCACSGPASVHYYYPCVSGNRGQVFSMQLRGICAWALFCFTSSVALLFWNPRKHLTGAASAYPSIAQKHFNGAVGGPSKLFLHFTLACCQGSGYPCSVAGWHHAGCGKREPA